MDIRKRQTGFNEWEDFFEEGISDAEDEVERTLDLVEVFKLNQKFVSKY
jgi:hypothetical protein